MKSKYADPNPGHGTLSQYRSPEFDPKSHIEILAIVHGGPPEPDMFWKEKYIQDALNENTHTGKYNSVRVYRIMHNKGTLTEGGQT